MYDIILKNGLVFDAPSGLRAAPRDIAISKGVVAAIEEQIDPSLGLEVHDLSGSMVSAGWVDIHVHAYGGLALRDVQMVGVLNGATAVVDAGDFGIRTFDDFVALNEDSVADVFGYVHPNPIGIPFTGTTRADYSNIDIAALDALIERRRDVILGLKMGAFGDLPFEFIEAGKEITQRNRIPFYLHIGEVSNFPAKRSQTRRAFALLTEGDIATHIYSNDHGRILDTDGRVVPEALEAHERGVIFDIGFGVGNFSYPLAERAMEQGIHTDTISSDQNSLCAKARADLPATMTRFLILGMPLEDIVERVTCAPARAVGLSDRGRLSVGARADITVFRVDSAEQMLDDADGVARTTDRVIVPISVYKDGVRHACCVDRVYEGDNFRMKVRPARVPAALEFDAEERSFLRGLFAEMERFTQKEWSGVAIHSAMDRVLAETGVPRKKALHAIYRVVLTPESFGFTPQIGPVLARMGREEVLAYREGLRGQLG